MRVHLLYVVYRHIHINDIGRKTEHVLLERILQGSGGGGILSLPFLGF